MALALGAERPPRKKCADLLHYGPTRKGTALPQILECLKKHGERLDSEIAAETGMPIALVRERAAGLAATGAVVTCNLTRFENGKRIDARLYRVSGYIPPAAPGRKAKAVT